MIQIVFAEDQTIVRHGIVSLLHTTEDIRIIAEAADGEEALAAILALKPDVALLDIRMPKRTGLEVLQELNRQGTQIPIVLLTTFDEDPLFLQAVHFGAKGFLLKDVSVERLAAALRIAAAGGTLLRPAMTERVARVIQEKGTTFDSAAMPDRLTPREADVLRLVAGGYSKQGNCRGADHERRLSEEPHVEHPFEVGSSRRTRAVLRGIELGYL